MKLTITPEELYTRTFLSAINALISHGGGIDNRSRVARASTLALDAVDFHKSAMMFTEQDKPDQDDTYCVSCDGPCQYDPSEDEDEDEDCDCDAAVVYILENASNAGLMFAATKILAKAGYDLEVEVDDED